MPELPEVETIKNELSPQILGCRFIEVTLLWPEAVQEPLPQEFCSRLPGQRLEDIHRRGKYLLFRLSEGETLILHLRMSGLLLLDPVFAGPKPHITAIFHLDKERELYFCDQRRFGVMWLVKDENKVIGKLGPEPLEHHFSPLVLEKILSGHSMPIKVLLCDQNLIAGIGNMYADEALFSAHIHPLRRANNLSKEEMNRLYHAIRGVLREGIESKGASTDTYRRPGGEIGKAHFKFRVAHRGGAPCYNCGTSIERILLRGRGTYFCPNCQRGEFQGRLFD
jgi:formamidopyrimidine-DNA glycosylase